MFDNSWISISKIQLIIINIVRQLRLFDEIKEVIKVDIKQKGSQKGTLGNATVNILGCTNIHPMESDGNLGLNIKHLRTFTISVISLNS